MQAVPDAYKTEEVLEAIAFFRGKVSKVTTNITLTTNAIKRHLSIELDDEEKRIEDNHKRGNK